MYLTSPIFNLSSKSNRIFLLWRWKYYIMFITVSGLFVEKTAKINQTNVQTERTIKDERKHCVYVYGIAKREENQWNTTAAKEMSEIFFLSLSPLFALKLFPVIVLTSFVIVSLLCWTHTWTRPKGCRERENNSSNFSLLLLSFLSIASGARSNGSIPYRAHKETQFLQHLFRRSRQINLSYCFSCSITLQERWTFSCYRVVFSIKDYNVLLYDTKTQNTEKKKLVLSLNFVLLVFRITVMVM